VLFVSADAIEDYEGGAAPVLVTHRNCLASGLEPLENFQCDAECFLLQPVAGIPSHPKRLQYDLLIYHWLIVRRVIMTRQPMHQVRHPSIQRCSTV
jgi:hypothetical protein